MTQILVIDDIDSIRDAICQILESAGYVVKEARNGIEGVKLFELDPPDLVITDIIMPEKDGIETINDLRALEPETRIIAMSGGGKMVETDFLLAAQAFGARAILRKPFQAQELLHVVAQALA
jgi:CheY-like chemotaxis protein